MNKKEVLKAKRAFIKNECENNIDNIQDKDNDWARQKLREYSKECNTIYIELSYIFNKE